MMNALFPFGIPWPTAFYFTLYLATLLIHVVFMNYVLAGTMVLAWAAMSKTGFRYDDGYVHRVNLLRDWMPFALGAAITAGVAPLLFLQILYQKQFYTANLLLSHRWMFVVPGLIVSFYLLYLLKTGRVAQWPRVARAAVALGALLGILFTGYSWTANHLLSTHTERWVEAYAHGPGVNLEPELWIRLSLWIVGSFPTMILLVSWQARVAQVNGRPIAPNEVRSASTLVLAFLVFSTVAGLIYALFLSEAARKITLGMMAGPFVVLFLVGIIVQAWAWWGQRRELDFSTRRLSLASIGLLLTLIGATVIREALRLTRLAEQIPYADHASARQVGGFGVFVVFFAVNAVVIAFCIWRVHHKLCDAHSPAPPAL